MKDVCNDTEDLLKLLELCNTAHQLDEHVTILKQLAENQARATEEIREKLANYVVSLREGLSAQQQSSQKLIQNSNTLLEWLKKEEEVSTLFKKTATEIQTVWKDIQDIAPSILAMMQSVLSINDIVDVLHVLSINTAVEAAKIGERGRAFSIIAKEMRRLADQSRLFIETIQDQGVMVNSRIKALDANLSHATDSYTSLEGTMDSFLKDSVLLRDNTKSVQQFIEQNKQSSETQLLEWETSIQHIESLETNAESVLTNSQHIQTMADSLFTMISDETERISQKNYQFHNKVIEEVQALAREVALHVQHNHHMLHELISTWSRSHQFYELLYVLDNKGVQISNNIYAQRYQAMHQPDEGFAVDRSYKDYFKIPMKSKQAYVSPVYFSQATKALCITVSAPLWKGNAIVGILCADLDLSYLQSFQDALD
jgi:methyl-accepting chemotaxis protein